jgi:hypothetical protein
MKNHGICRHFKTLKASNYRSIVKKKKKKRIYRVSNMHNSFQIILKLSRSVSIIETDAIQEKTKT